MFCDNCGRVLEKAEDVCQGCGVPRPEKHHEADIEEKTPQKSHTLKKTKGDK